jgi:hypothetical protein
MNVQQILGQFKKAANTYGNYDQKPKKQKYVAMSQQISMCTFFDNIKSALLKQWEFEIVQKGSKFENQK